MKMEKLICISYKLIFTIWVLGFDSREGLGIFLFIAVSRPVSLLSNGYQELFLCG
jgi:hypothetical protein